MGTKELQAVVNPIYTTAKGTVLMLKGGGDPDAGSTFCTDGRETPDCFITEAAQSTAVRMKTHAGSREIRRNRERMSFIRTTPGFMVYG